MLKRLLALGTQDKLTPIFVYAIYAVLGSILGAGALDIVSFHKHVSINQDFQEAHIWGYFLAPWLAAVLGLIVFALLQSGLLVFSGGISSSSNSEIAQLGYLAVGFLSGFGWLQAVEKVREIVQRFFAAHPKRSDDEPSRDSAALASSPNDRERTAADTPKPAADEHSQNNTHKTSATRSEEITPIETQKPS